MYDFSSYNCISLEPSSPRTLTAQDIPAIAAMMANARERAFVVAWLATLCTGECCADLCIVVVHEGRLFLKNAAQHRTSDMRVKIACVGIRFSVNTVVTPVVTTVIATVLTIVVTTVVTENRMPMHATFFSHAGCAMSGNDFSKKSCAFCP